MFPGVTTLKAQFSQRETSIRQRGPRCQGSAKTSPWDSRANLSLPMGLRRVSSPVWFSTPSPRVPCPSGLRRPRRLLGPERGRGPGPSLAESQETGVARGPPRSSGRRGRGSGRMRNGLTEARKEGREVRLRFLREAAAATTVTRPALAPCTRCNAQTALRGGAGGGGGGRHGEFSAMNLRGLFQDFNPR